MKIHFCDLCNESVPQAALDSGTARLIKGRVICATCEAAMSHAAGHGHAPAGQVQNVRHAPHEAPAAAPTPAAHAEDAPRVLERVGSDTAVIAPESAPSAVVPIVVPPLARTPVHAGAIPAPAPAGSNAGLAWVAGLAIAFTALSIFVTDDRLARVTRSQDALTDELAKKDDALHGLATEFSKIHPALAGVETRLTERLEAERVRNAASAELLTASREEARRYAERLEALALEVERLRARVEQPGLGTEIERRFDELSGRIAKAEDERRALAEQLAAAQAAEPAAKAPAAEAAAPAAPAAWLRSVADLTSTEETVRWDAVTTLGATNDPAVVPHLLPMLSDTTWLVRMAAARVLGEMRVREAVPQLIEMLGDEDSAARETAWIALRVITGKDLKFDSFAPEAERAKRAKAWSEWWKKEGDAPKPASGA